MPGDTTPQKGTGTTLAHQIFLLLRGDILSGRVPAGSQLSSEKDMAARHGVSRVTVRRAFERLEQDGLIRRVHGQGTFVEARDRPVLLTGQLEGYEQQADWLNRNTDVTLIEIDEVIPPADVALAMELADGARVQRSVRLRSFEGTPSLLLDTYLPDWVADGLDPNELRDGSVQQGLRRMGIVLDEVDYTVTAIAADLRLAELLQVPVATALLSMVWVFRDSEGRIVEYQFAHGRPDTYALRTRLRSFD